MRTRTVAVAFALASLAGGGTAQQPPPLAELESIGTGTPGATGVPRLVSVGRPAIGEPGMGVAIEGGLPAAAALLVVGPGVDPTPLAPYGATLVPQLPALRLPLGVLDAQGHSSLFSSGPAAASAVLAGLEFAVQGLVADPAAQGGVAFTQGLRLRFGAGYAAPGLFSGLGYRAQDSYAGADQLFVTGDFDGNRRRDIALLVSGSGLERLKVFRQLDDGSFAPPVASFVPAGQTTDSLAADVDGDGRLDLVLAQDSVGGPSVLVLAGLGDGRFEPPTTLASPAAAGPSHIAVADVTGDGTLDVVASEWQSLQLGVLAGFALPATPFPVWGSARALRLGDVTGDGTLDAVALVWAPGFHLSVLRGLGGGDFALPVLSATGVDDAGCLELGDLDGDGDLDAVVGCLSPQFATVLAPTLLTLANDGSGSFTPIDFLATSSVLGAAVRQVELADVEPDGDLDVLVVHEIGFFSGQPPVTILANQGDGTLDPPLPLMPHLAIDAVDMDADGQLDIASSLPGFVVTAQCARGLGGGRFDLPQQLPEVKIFPADSGDFDGDGDLDIAGQVIMPDGTSAIAVSAWSAPLGFGTPAMYDAQGANIGVDGLVVADVDLDDRPDLVAAANDAVRIFHGDGAGGLLPPELEALSKASVPRVTDIDGDDRPDLVVSRLADGLSVLLGLPGGGFAGAVTTPGPTSKGFDRFEVGDVDADGRADVVAQGSQGFHVLRGSGDGHFAGTFVPGPGSGPAEDLPLLLADFDGDGDLDLARLDFGALVTIWSNDGQGGFTAGQQTIMSDFTFLMAAADVNLDGALDLLGSDLRLGFGDGSFAAPHPGIAADVVGDFDGDGDVDAFINGYVFSNRIH